MKTNLLKVALSLTFFTVILGITRINAQIRTYENFDYPVGTSFAGQDGGFGWAGPWTGGGTVATGYSQIIAGNMVGTTGNTGYVHGGFGNSSFRNLAVPFNGAIGNSMFLSFFYQSGQLGEGGGMTLFSGSAEAIYIGRTADELIGTGSAFDNPERTGTPGDQQGKVSVMDAHNYLVKITNLAGATYKIDVWADYLGSVEPVANDSEPTFQYTAYRSENAVTGVSRIRITGWGSLEPNRTKFDGIRFFSTFFKSTDDLLPLTDVKLSAKATAAGNVISWTSTGNEKVVSITVSRADENGKFIPISGSLSANSVSFTDTNPLPGTNIYQLSSLDLNSDIPTIYGVKSVKGFDTESTFFPNPVVSGSDITVISSNAGSNNSVSIFDLTGKKVATKSFNGSKTSISTQSIPKGVYILSIDGGALTKKLVVE